MYVLYRVSDGEKVSDSSKPIDNANPDLAVKQTDKKGIWNAQTLDFDPRPVRRIKTPLEFMELFTDFELATIYDAAEVDSAVKVFIKKLDRAQEVDLDNATTVAGLNALEAGGLIAAGRAAEILNG